MRSIITSLERRSLAGEIDLVYVSTEDQAADIFTKALRVEKLCIFHDMLGVMVEMDLSLRGSAKMSSSTRDTHDGPG